MKPRRAPCILADRRRPGWYHLGIVLDIFALCWTTVLDIMQNVGRDPQKPAGVVDQRQAVRVELAVFGCICAPCGDKGAVCCETLHQIHAR